MPVPLQQGVPNQQVLARREAAERQEASIRRSRKPTDKNIPDGLEGAVIGDGVSQYKSLRDVEKKLDAAMIRKRLDIQDSVNRTAKRFQTLRIWISNTVENQPWQQQNSGENNGSGSTPSGGRYRVKIEGRLLDDDIDPTIPNDSDNDNAETDANEQRDSDAMEQDEPDKEKEKEKEKKPTQRKRLSHFFKSVTVEFDKPSTDGAADLAPIKWNKPVIPANAMSLPPSADFDSFEFSRNAEVNLNTTISLVRDENPERFRLSNDLASILDTDEETRSGIVVGLWEYIKALDLQESEEKRAIRCDERLKRVGPNLISLYIYNHL